MQQMEDLVDLIFVTHHNHVFFSRITRQQASDNIAGWFDMRELVRKKGEGWEDAERFLKQGTFASNSPYGKIKKKEKAFSRVAVGWEFVQGMYVQEIPKDALLYSDDDDDTDDDDGAE